MPRGRKPSKPQTEEAPLVEQIESRTEESINGEEKESLFEMASSGSDLFDLVLGGGFPYGKIINIVGDRSTGKTLLSSEVIAQARKRYAELVKWVYDDAESGYSFDSKKLYGFDIFTEDQDSSYTLEEFEVALDVQMDLLRRGERLIYVLDCLDALTSEEEITRYAKRKKQLAAEMEKEEEESDDDSSDSEEEGSPKKEKKVKGTYGMEKQKKLSEFFRLLRKRINDKKCLLIIISQVRTNIGVMFGPKHVRTGGKALDFYASQIIWLAETEKHVKKGRTTGVTIKAKTTKNKVGLPFRECFINILFDYGVDNISTNIDFLYDRRTDAGKEKESKRLNWDGELFTPKALIMHIEKNNLEAELTRRVKEKWDALEDSISQTKWRKKK